MGAKALTRRYPRRAEQWVDKGFTYTAIVREDSTYTNLILSLAVGRHQVRTPDPAPDAAASPDIERDVWRNSHNGQRLSIVAGRALSEAEVSLAGRLRAEAEKTRALADEAGWMVGSLEQLPRADTAAGV